MKGYRFQLLKLSVSFIGVDILVLLSFGLGYYWAAPYMEGSAYCFYSQIHAQTFPA